MSGAGSPARALWIATAAVATVIAYVIGAVIAYGDSDRDPNAASFASVAMALLVVIATIVGVTRRSSRLPVTLAQVALVFGVVGVIGTLLS